MDSSLAQILTELVVVTNQRDAYQRAYAELLKEKEELAAKSATLSEKVAEKIDEATGGEAPQEVTEKDND